MGGMEVFHAACGRPENVPAPPMEGMEVFHAPGGRASVPHCPLRAWKHLTPPVEVWKCSIPAVEGVEVFCAACGGHGSVLHCPWRAWKCSKPPCGGHGSVLCCPLRAWKSSLLVVKGMKVFWMLPLMGVNCSTLFLWWSTNKNGHTETHILYLQVKNRHTDSVHRNTCGWPIF